MCLMDFHAFLQFLFLNAFILIHVQCDNENGNCLAEKPKLKPTDPLTVEFFYVSLFGGNIEEDLCTVITQFNGLISIKFKFGAFTTKDKNGELICGSNNCTVDRRTACRYKSYDKFDTCDQLPFFDLIQIGDCICKRQADYLLIENNKARENYKIDPKDLPTLVFNGKYDPCVNISSADTIKAYICELYQGKAAPCLPVP